MELLLEQILKLKSLSEADIHELYDDYRGLELNLRNSLFLLKNVTFRQACNYRLAFKNDNTCVSLHDAKFESDDLSQLKILWDTILDNENKYVSALNHCKDFIAKMFGNV